MSFGIGNAVPATQDDKTSLQRLQGTYHVYEPDTYDTKSSPPVLLTKGFFVGVVTIDDDGNVEFSVPG